MIAFEAPSWLWLLLPGILGWWVFVRVQRRALAWLSLHVAPRFRQRFSVYSPKSLALHMGMLLVMGIALAVAAAGPFSAGETEAASATGRLLFLVDASSSMYAEDVESFDSVARPGDGALRRIDVARSVAGALMRDLEGYRFALGSFSGVGAIHLPMTADRLLVEDALRTLEVHSYYRNTGSSFSGALDLVPHFVDRRGYRLQVVLLSDGEQPTPEDYGDALAALAEQGVPVHTLAIGSLDGQSRRILSFQDVLERKEDPRVLVEYTTRRVDEHLERISAKTKGRFAVAGPGVVAALTEEILQAGSEPEPFEHDAARRDLAGRYLLIFLIGLFIDTLWFGRKPIRPPPAFDLNRLGAPSLSIPPIPPVSPAPDGRFGRSGRRARRARVRGVLVVLIGLGLATACALPFGEERGSPRRQAHRENERGIDRDALGRHGAARVHYERSQAYGVEPQVPAHNLARSVLLSGDFSEAHDLFQEALLLDPELPEAHFNDAMTLYLWGAAERDPKNCDLERTRDLWTQAGRRLSSASAAAVKREGGQAGDVESRARDNRRALGSELEEVERLIADPPDECGGDGGGSGGASGGAGGQGGGGGGAGAGSQDPSSEDPSPQGENEDEEVDGGGAGGAGGDDGDDAEPQDPDQGGGGSGADSEGSGELTDDELEEIGRQLERLAEQARETGKFHRRTLPEQFRQEDWSNPDTAIWW